jgi:hypothetical protein
MFNLEEYTTVAERIKLFRQMFPMGRIITTLITEDATRVVFKAEMYRDDLDVRPFSTGYAREITAERGVNKDFALENCETSSIGIAAKNADIGTDKKAISREEAAKVNATLKVKAELDKVKAKMAQTSSEYIPVEKAHDPWTTAPAQQAQTLESAVEMVKDILGGTTDSDIQTCVHGEMVWKTGTGKTGKQWGHWRCIGKVLGEAERCEPRWYEITADGTWKPQVQR